jgi:hypothetical protein
MAAEQELQLMLASTSRHTNDRVEFEYALGYFTSAIDEHWAKFVTHLVHLFLLAGERVLIGLSPADEERWRRMTKSGWTTLTERPEKSTRWKILERAWVVGYAHEIDKFAEVYQYAWNYTREEPLIVVVASETDDGSALAGAEERAQVCPDHEHQLLNHYFTIVNRYYDGLWIRILSSRVGPVEMQALLEKASESTISVPIVLMERTRWPSFAETRKQK